MVHPSGSPSLFKLLFAALGEVDEAAAEDELDVEEAAAPPDALPPLPESVSEMEFDLDEG